jgi:hypothetical protein
MAGPDMRFDKMVQCIGAQVARGVGAHVAQLELALKREYCALGEQIHTWCWCTNLAKKFGFGWNQLI